jgi:hypothetical protein
MKKMQFEFYAISESEHSFTIEAESQDEALRKALERCASNPGFFMGYVQANLWERAPNEAAVRSWLYEDGEFVEAAGHEDGGGEQPFTAPPSEPGPVSQ